MKNLFLFIYSSPISLNVIQWDYKIFRKEKYNPITIKWIVVLYENTHDRGKRIQRAY